MGMNRKLIDVLDSFMIDDDCLSNEKIAEILIAHDIVPVVRCKDCKHWTYDGYHKHHYCSNKMGLRYVCPANNFCSKGERKDNGT